MNKIYLFFVYVRVSFGINAQNPIRAWESTYTSDSGENLKSILILSDQFQVITTYNADSGNFISTNGGSWKLSGNTMTEKVEFDSENPEAVGTEISFDIFINDSIMGIVDADIKMKRIDDGTPGELRGAGLMSGRTMDGKKQLRDTD